MNLSVIVPATDPRPGLDRCLDALRASLEPGDELLCVTEPASAGAAAARNLGAMRATTEVLVFVDSDIVVAPDALDRMRAAFDSDPGLGAIFGSLDDDPEAPGTVSAFRNLLHHHVHQASPGPATTFAAGIGGVRRAAFEAVDGFAPQQRYLEDVDLGMRLTARGERIVLDPAIQGKHLKGYRVRDMIRTDFAHRALPWIDLLVRHRALPTALNLGWRHRLSALASVWICAALAVGEPLLALCGPPALFALNVRFYALLRRARGTRFAAAGFVLHWLHHLTSVAAVPVGLMAVGGSRLRGRVRRKQLPEAVPAAPAAQDVAGR